MHERGKTLILLACGRDILRSMKMKALIEAIVANPESYSPEDFQFHCGLRALVTICRDLQEQRHPLEEMVEAHEARVHRLSHA